MVEFGRNELSLGAVAFPPPQCYDRRMKAKIWLNKANSFEEAREFDSAYYRDLSDADRLETTQILREAHFKSTGLFSNENGKRLRRVLRIIKQP